ncbi:hypothetical protein [Nonomuraea typhae]|nr:hypothetical protein [Nonomuraea typhae]
MQSRPSLATVPAEVAIHWLNWESGFFSRTVISMGPLAAMEATRSKDLAQ